jgi:hypothetical protein
MFQRLMFLGLGLVALLGVMGTPRPVHAQHFRGGFRPSSSAIRPSFRMNHQQFVGTHRGAAMRHAGGAMVHHHGVPTMHSATMHTPQMHIPTMRTPTMRLGVNLRPDLDVRR